MVGLLRRVSLCRGCLLPSHIYSDRCQGSSIPIVLATSGLGQRCARQHNQQDAQKLAVWTRHACACAQSSPLPWSPGVPSEVPPTVCSEPYPHPFLTSPTAC